MRRKVIGMSLVGRLGRAEAGLGDALLWEEVQRLTAGTDESPEELFDYVRSMLAKYGHLQVLLPGGRVDLKPMVQAMAEGEGFDYDELLTDVKRSLRQVRAREARRRR